MTSTRAAGLRLNIDQENAAYTRIGPTIIIGAEGTGKTTTIAARMVALVANGIPSQVIVCWTHAADGGDCITTAMAEFMDLSGTPSTIGTPQSLALELLRARGMEVLGRSPDFTVWHRQDAQELVADVLLGADGRTRRAALTQAAQILRFHWLCRSGYPEELLMPRRPAWTDVVEQYMEMKEACNAVDDGDLLPVLKDALELNQDFREGFAQVLCRHLLIDDLHRLSPVEYQVALLLTGEEESITVTFNPNARIQSIVDADNGVLEAFRTHYPACENATFRLRMDMRMTHGLGGVVQSLIADPTMTHLVKQKKTTSFRTFFTVGQKSRMGVPPALLEFEGSPVDMCRDIMGRSVDLVHKGYHLEDQAFIYQDASMLEHLRVLALNLRIPYRVLDDEPAPWERDARRVTALLETVLNGRDAGAVRIAACVDPRHNPPLLGAGVTRQLMMMLADQGINLGQAVRRYGANPLIDADLREVLHAVADAWYHLSRRLDDPSVSVYDLCRQAVNHLEDIVGTGDPLRDRPQVKDLLALAEREADRYQPGDSKPSPREELIRFLDSITPGIQPDPLNTERNAPGGAVTFASLDAAQGLEWPVVWAVGVSDGILPGDIPTNDVHLMRDAQRRFLVWSTRARDLLFYCHAIMSGPTRDARPSRFLQPVGNLLIREVVPSQDLGRPTRPFSSSSATRLRIETSTSHPGLRTRHDRAVRQR